MRVRIRKTGLVMATVPAALVMAAVPVGVATAATQSSASASAAQHQYIVILHQQNGSLGARSAARRSAVTAQQKPLLAQLRSGGGRELASTSLLNAMVVSSTARARLGQLRDRDRYRVGAGDGSGKDAARHDCGDRIRRAHCAARRCRDRHRR